MKAQATSILLCALLCSTLGHEYLSAKRLAPEARSKYHSPLSHYENRAATALECEWVCEGGSNSTGGLQIIVNETTSLVGVVNVTAKVALVIDIEANLVGLFNGSTGAVVIINIKTGSGVYIAAGQTTISWISSKQSFELFFRSLTTLQVFLNLKVGTTFTSTSVTTVVIEVIASLLIQLSARLAVYLRGDLTIVIAVLLKITTSIVASLQGSLKGILKLFGNGLIAIYGDIVWLAYVLKGLELFLSNVTGGLAALLKAKVQLDIALLLGARTGIELLINLLLAIVARVDLSIVANLLNSVGLLLEVIIYLGGNVSTGVNGVWKIIGQLIAVIKGTLKLDLLIATLLEFAAEQESNLSISIEGLVEVIKIQISKYSSSETIKLFVEFVTQLQKGQLIIGGINISEIIVILVKGGAGGAIDLVVTILLRLSAVIKVVISIPSLLLNLLALLNSSAGVQLLLKLIPGLSINITVNGKVNIAAAILQGVNLTTIIKLIASGFDLQAVLTSVPVLGKIYLSVSKSLSVCSKGSLSLTTILKSSGATEVVVQIQVWFRALLKSAQGGSTTVGVVSPVVPVGGGSLGIFGSSSNGSIINIGGNGGNGGNGSINVGTGGNVNGSTGSHGGNGGSNNSGWGGWGWSWSG